MASQIQPSFKETFWFKDDPRYHIDKRAKIIILYSSSNGYYKQAVVAEVDTKNGWYIGFSNCDRITDVRKSIIEGEDWPEGWIWTYHP